MPEDEPFLLTLYATTRTDELAGLDWTPEQFDTFVSMQFRAQQAHYRQHFADADFVLLLVDDEPIGSFGLHRQPDKFHIIDMALMPAWRNRGVGTHILQEIQNEARDKQLPVMLRVLPFNPAQRLYVRLGFQHEATEGLHHLMLWRP